MRSSDSVYIKINGVWEFAFIDSVGSGGGDSDGIDALASAGDGGEADAGLLIADECYWRLDAHLAQGRPVLPEKQPYADECSNAEKHLYAEAAGFECVDVIFYCGGHGVVFFYWTSAVSVCAVCWSALAITCMSTHMYQTITLTTIPAMMRLVSLSSSPAYRSAA